MLSEVWKQILGSEEEKYDRKSKAVYDFATLGNPQTGMLTEKMQDLYAEDGCHPNEAGTRLAAETIAEIIKEDQARKQAEEKPGTYDVSRYTTEA